MNRNRVQFKKKFRKETKQQKEMLLTPQTEHETKQNKAKPEEKQSKGQKNQNIDDSQKARRQKSRTNINDDRK